MNKGMTNYTVVCITRTMSENSILQMESSRCYSYRGFNLSTYKA